MAKCMASMIFLAGLMGWADSWADVTIKPTGIAFVTHLQDQAMYHYQGIV